jgi:NADPH2:quinone reductase
MTHAIRIHEYGGPENLSWEEIELAVPAEREVRLKQTAVGLNFIDVYVRTGLYPQENFPIVPGMEGAGVVSAVGSGVGNLAVGDRVAYAGPIGAYSQERLIDADRLLKLPNDIDDQKAASMMLQGMTAQFLLRRTFEVGPDTTLLFHAAAGGVGLIACQWAAHLGATVIGTVGSGEKADLARANGCTHVIDYKRDDFVEGVKELTGGAGVDVVYDSIGQATFPGSLDCLKPMGMWVTFGQASGPLPDLHMSIFAQKGSLFATRPLLFTYIAKREDLEATANDLFDVVAGGHVAINVNQTYPLQDAAQAHRDLEARKTTGSTVLLP